MHNTYSYELLSRISNWFFLTIDNDHFENYISFFSIRYVAVIIIKWFKEIFNWLLFNERSKIFPNISFGEIVT